MILHQLVVFLTVLTLGQNAQVQVKAPIGEILGTTLTSRLGKTIYSFRGLRYAQPPIGNLRFKPLVAIEHYEGVYNATTDGFICPQPDDSPISEDCLVLNVYTAKLPSQNHTNPKRPVIIYLHSGGFYSVTGHSSWTGPQYFLDQDIVLVTLNYRLGSLGFLSTGPEAPGNNGLKDQVVAMKWVQRNIATFGGDPNCVTLYGYSAGAWSVTLHLVSPMSKGLFHRAIVSSGSAISQWVLPKNQIELARKQARFVGCPDHSPAAILDCLRTKSAVEIGETLYQFGEFGMEPVIIWSPVIEEDYGQERFLTDDPVKLIQDGFLEKVPVMAGMTKDEFANRAFRTASNVTLLEALDRHFETYGPICFLYERNSDKSTNVSKAVRQFYFGQGEINNKSLDKLIELYQDSLTSYGVYRTVDLLSRSLDVYYYNFTYQGNYSHFYLPGTSTPYGVVHHDDLIYGFYISRLFPFFDKSYPEGEMVDTFTRIWANFAKTGKPIPVDDPGVAWTPFRDERRYLDIGETLVMKDFKSERYEFWDSLY